MDFLTEKKFSFTSNALKPDTFGVVSFKGTEGISRPYEFEILLVSESMDIDLAQVLQNPARLDFHREEGGDVGYSGILANFEQLHSFGEICFYRAFLVPKLWWLSMTQHNQVILNKTVKDFVTDVLKDGGLSTLDFEFRLQGNYPPVEYVCQYGESHLDFAHRWLEHEGIYYFFEQSPRGEKVIFTDTSISHMDLPQGKTLYYRPASGTELFHRDEVVHVFNCRRQQMPGSVFLKDYNYRKPSVEMTGKAQVDPQGRGQVFYYHEHFRTPEAGHQLAKVRAESILSRQEVFHGQGSVPYMLPGFTFEITDHYRGTYNQKYLAIEIEHEGSQTGYLTSGIKAGLSEKESQVFYKNSFAAIKSDVQFRPQVKTPKPKISGTIVAKVDAGEGSGDYADIDNQGRYLVTLPFDLSGRKHGKASVRLRMAQPYAGPNEGMHFPLHKGTEVLLTFIDGDPDRPIISGAVPNPETPSPVQEGNRTKNLVQSAGGNLMEMQDEEGQERMFLSTPFSNAFFHMGAPPPPGPGQSLGAAAWQDSGTAPADFSVSLYTDDKAIIRAERGLKLHTSRMTEGQEQNEFITDKLERTAGEDHGDQGFTAGLTVAGGSDMFLTAGKDYQLIVGRNAREWVKGKHYMHVDDSVEIVVGSGDDEGDNIVKFQMRKDGNKLQIYSKGDMEFTTDHNMTINGKGHKDETFEETNYFNQSNNVSIMGGANTEVILGNDFEFILGGKQDLSAGGSMELFLGLKLAIELSLGIEIKAAFGLEFKLAELTESKFKIESKTLHLLIGSGTTITSGTLKLDTRLLKIHV